MALQALWDVTQQFNNKNGSILTSGKIYIYYRGRTALATSYHDEDGTVVNSNPVLLDNNGRATAFVNPIYSYTIVVCDYYGKELFSQDITLHDAISTAEDVVVIGTDGSVLLDTTQLPNGVQYDLSVNTDIIATKQSVDDVKDDLDDLTVIVNQHTTQIGQLQDDVEAVENALASKKDKQNALEFNGAATKTVKKITQNANGEMDVEFEDIDIKGVQYTTARFPFNSNKIVKLAEIPLYPTFQYQGSGRANLQLLITDSYGSEAIFSLGIIQSGTSSHMVQPKGVFKYIHPGNGRTTYPIKMMHVRPDNASAPMTGATLYLYAEFDESYNQQADWSFKAVINEGSTSSTSKVENAWTFRNTVIAPQADFDQARSWWYLAPSSMETIPNVEITSEDNSVQVTETTDVQTNTKTFDLSVNVDDALEYGQFRATNVTGQAQLTKIKGNLELNNYLIRLKKGNSYHFTVRGSYVATSAANTATIISYIEYSSFTNIPVNVDNTITEPQYFEISYDIYNYAQNSDYNVSFAAISGGKVSELWVEVHNLNGVTVNGSGGTEYTAGDAIDLTNDTISVKHGKGLTVNASNELEVKAGNGLTFDEDTLEIEINSEVTDVVNTVEKLKTDLDTQLTVNFDMPNVDNVYDFADPSVIGMSNGAVMLCQAFTVPINHDIRVDDGVTENPTLLGIYAKQAFTGKKIMLALYVYDFDTGYTDYVGDTGPVSVTQGRNEFPLKHINPNISELKSSCVYYASLYLPSNAHSNGLYLAGCPSYSNASYINATPRFTVGVENITYNNTEIDMTDATTGRLDYNDGNGNYYIGPWSDNYNERPAIPRFFMQIRNGEADTPIVVEPFTDIGSYTLKNTSSVNDVFGSTITVNTSTYGAMFMEVTPSQDVDVTGWVCYDNYATDDRQWYGNVYDSAFENQLSQRSDGTLTELGEISTGVYGHQFTRTSPLHLTANTTYRFLVGIPHSNSDMLVQYNTPSVPKNLHLFESGYNVSQWVSYSRANNVQGIDFLIKDANHEWRI